MNYYVSAILPNTTVSSNKATYTQLALQSYTILNCAPPPLGKRNTSSDIDDIQVYPNPSSTGFTLTNMPVNWKIQINDIIGKTIWEKQGSGNTTIPSAGLPKGIYTSIITNLNTNDQITKKLLVQ